MTKLHSVAAGIALAVAFAAAPAQAQDPVVAQEGVGAGAGGWNSQYGMIFSVQNVFQNSSDAVIGDFGGGVGLQYNLSAQRALRLSVNLARASNPAYTTESTNLVTGVTTESFVAPAFTSRYDVDLGALYVMRLAPSAIAPYLGFGGGVGYFQEAREFENDTAVGSITNVNDMYRAISLNAAGVLGVEWRVHKAVALFAEYGLGVDLVTYVSDKGETRTTSRADGSLLSGTETDGSSTKFFNFDTGLGQGGQIGLVAFF
jgi:hypothetical protein